ncbi:phosphatidate phosphatase APP1 [Arcanobacterium pluranimalium]|uniref:App1 family protein n=1 Tax=Arcanobacterium pluranimalium TaxID=108028 RepID=UPI00195EC9EE|nr:phosphatase domain-containing protein [Arcanobacterium pluranimalium]MBM7824363.1 phosphatidate phosphatase APP1 [Arcanobacterium pluranimalium]
MALADIARSIEENFNRRGIVRRRREGWLPQIVPFSGYGSTSAVKILARALMADPKEGSSLFDLDKLRNSVHKNPAINAVRDIAELAIETGAEAQRGWRQFFTTQVGFLPVTVVVGDKRIKTRTDRNGYIDLLVENHGLTPGWHEVELIPAAGEAVKAPVMIVSPTATKGLVSDIDDTIMVTWLPRAALAAWNSFVVHTNSRKTVSGMANFYRNILQEHPDAPVFYLSTGAWNTFSTLEIFLSTFRFPVGPLLMTDWGPTPTGLFRSGQEHKKTQLRNLLIMFPNIEWTLVGDDGQHDPLIYDELAREHPSRVDLIALRELNPVEQVLSHGTPDPKESAREDSDIERHGVPVIRGKDGHELLTKFREIRP